MRFSTDLLYQSLVFDGKMLLMTQEPHDLILDHLRALRSTADRVEKHQGEHDKRFSNIERQLAAVRGDIAVIHS